MSNFLFDKSVTKWMGLLIPGVLISANCARPGAPIGGPIDNVGPQVVGTSPDTFAVLEDFQGPIVVFFDERISETANSGTLRDAVRVSPIGGEVLVTHRNRSLEIEMVGGFREGTVYRVTVLPIVRDLFQNTMPYPFEFLFSTGPEMIANVAAGTVIDGITLRPSSGAKVIASTDSLSLDLSSEDNLKHLAIPDSSGVYAFRYLPSGSYFVTAFVDENRSDSPEATEPMAGVRLDIQTNDTVFADMRMLRPDSTPPVLNALGVIDSMTLLVEFDDYLDPKQFPLQNARATFSSDSTNLAEISEIWDEYQFDARREALRNNSRDTLLEAQVDSIVFSTEDSSMDPRVPSRNVYLLLPEPIRVGITYEVTISGLMNVNGIGPGGGTGSVMRDAPEMPQDTLELMGKEIYER